MNNKDISSDIISLTKRLIAIDSTHDNVQSLHAVLNTVEEELNGEFPIQKFVSNGIPSMLVRNTTDEKKHFRMILNAHLDVVPGRENDFIPKEKDGKLYGRGAYDMKAAAAAMTYVFKEVANKVSYPLGLQLVTDEELGGFNGTKHQIDKGLRSDFAITGDCGSNLRIMHKTKGMIWLKLHARGITAHSAYIWRGENALMKLHKALTILHELFPVPKSRQWVDILNLAKIETSNTALNSVPDDATACLDLRFTQGTKDSILKKIKDALHDDIEIEVLFCNEPNDVSPDNHNIRLLEKAIEDVTHNKAVLASAYAQSDLRHFTDIGGRGIEFGVSGAHQHGDNEWVDTQSIDDYYTILKTYLLEIDKVKL